MLFLKLIKKGYRPYVHRGVNHLKKPIQIKSTDFLVRVIDAYTVDGAQVFKHSQECSDSFIQPQNEYITTVKEVEDLYKLAVKEALDEVDS